MVKIRKTIAALLIAGIASVNTAAIICSAEINENQNIIINKDIYSESGRSRNEEKNITLYMFEKNVTRGEAVSFVIDLIEKNTDIESIKTNIRTSKEINSAGEFKDVGYGDKNYKEIKTAKDIGIVIGSPANEFNPDSELKKKDYSLIIGRMFDILSKHGLEYKLPNPNIEDLKDYSDYHLLDGTNENYYSIALQLGIIKPKTTTEIVSPELTRTIETLDVNGKVTESELLNLKEALDKIRESNYTKDEIINKNLEKNNSAH